MSPLAEIGLRLARSGGRLRAGSIAAGNAVGALLLLTAVALPEALFPDALERAGQRVTLLAALMFLLVPAVVLLVTVGRLSSGTRDRRLAALRMLGLSPHRVRRIAAVENGSLALVGAAAGAVLFAGVVAPVSDHLRPRLPWLGAPLHADVLPMMAIVALITAVSVVVGTAATWERTLPAAARSEARVRTPRAWRLLVLAAGIGALGLLAQLDMAATPNEVQMSLFLGGSAVTGVGLALTTPLIVSWAGRLLVRAQGVTPRLTGRAIQADVTGASRVVAGLGVAIFLTSGALGVLGHWEQAPQIADALRSFGPGPQRLWLSDWSADAAVAARLDDNAITELKQIPGVYGVAPRIVDANCDEDGSCGRAIVGTCAQLALVLEASGCDDQHAAVIVNDWDGTNFRGLKPGTELTLTTWDPASGDTLALGTVASAATPIVQDTAAQQQRWAWQADDVAFVPASLIAEPLPTHPRVDVIATGGIDVQRHVTAWAETQGVDFWAPHAAEFQTISAIRAAVWALCGVAIAVALVVLALGAADHANERRRAVARQITLGMPAGILRRSQLLQTLLPVLVACTLALMAGLIGVHAYTNMADGGTLITPRGWATLAAIAAAGGLVVAVSTVPLIRTRLTPELLRRE